MNGKRASLPRTILAGLGTGAIATLVLCEIELVLTLTIDKVPPATLLGPSWPLLVAIYMALGAAAGLLLAVGLWLLKGLLRLERALVSPLAAFRRIWLLGVPAYLLFFYLNDEVLHPAMHPRVLWLDAFLLLAFIFLPLAWARRATPGPSRAGKGLALASLLVALISFAPLILTESSSENIPVPAARAKRAFNIVLVTIDTLRARQLGCYGYPRPTTPVIDRLAKEGIRFTNAHTEITQTDPSHATMFTGLHATNHGLTRNGWSLREENVTLAERLQAAGYRTFAAISVQHLSSHFGFMQGMETYHNSSLWDRFFLYSRSKHSFFSIPILLRSDAITMLIGKPIVPIYRRADGATDDFLRWLENQDGSAPFFAWLHYFDPHAPYEPLAEWERRFIGLPLALPEGVDWDDGAKLRFDRYDAEIAFTDAQVGRVVEALAARGFDDRTLIVVTSDHGESLGEHAHRGHNGKAYDEILKVPWIMRLPGQIPDGVTVEDPISLVDMTPTLLAFVGLPVPDTLDGKVISLTLPGGEGSPARSRAILARSETWHDELHLGVVQNGFKMIETRRLSTGEVMFPSELYDLKRDPMELNDLADQEEARLSHLQHALRAMLVDVRSQRELDSQTRRLLRSLGYIE